MALQPLNSISSGTCGAGRPQAGSAPFLLIIVIVTIIIQFI